MNIENIRSITEFKRNITETDKLVMDIIKHIHFFNNLKTNPSTSDSIKKIKILENMEFDQNRENKIFEVFFIKLYASFEAFMTDLLRDLYTQYPESISSKRKIFVEDIINMETQQSTRNLIIDQLAIEDSYTLEKWINTLRDTFKINVFSDTKLKRKMGLFDIARNMLLHSGKKFNSKIVKDCNKILNNEKLTDFSVMEIEIVSEITYHNLKSSLFKVVEVIEKNLD